MDMLLRTDDPILGARVRCVPRGRPSFAFGTSGFCVDFLVDFFGEGSFLGFMTGLRGSTAGDCILVDCRGVIGD